MNAPNPSMTRPPRPRPPLAAAVVLWLAVAVAFLGLLASPVLWLGIPFLFDAPGSMENPIMGFLVAGILALPAVSIAMAVVAVLALRRYSRFRLVLAVLLGVGWVAYMAGVIETLEVRCGGTFNCQPLA